MEEKESSNPTRDLGTTPSALQHGLTAEAARRTVEIPRAPSPREVLGCHPSTPKDIPMPARGQEANGQASGGAPSRDPHAAGRRPIRLSPGHPRGAQTAPGGGGAVTGVPVSRVPTARVKCSDLPLPMPTARVSEARSAGGHPPRAPLGPDPTRDSRIRTPNSGLHAPGEVDQLC